MNAPGRTGLLPFRAGVLRGGFRCHKQRHHDGAFYSVWLLAAPTETGVDIGGDRCAPLQGLVDYWDVFLTQDL